MLHHQVPSHYCCRRLRVDGAWGSCLSSSLSKVCRSLLRTEGFFLKGCFSCCREGNLESSRRLTPVGHGTTSPTAVALPPAEAAHLVIRKHQQTLPALLQPAASNMGASCSAQRVLVVEIDDPHACANKGHYRCQSTQQDASAHEKVVLYSEDDGKDPACCFSHHSFMVCWSQDKYIGCSCLVP